MDSLRKFSLQFFCVGWFSTCLVGQIDAQVVGFAAQQDIISVYFYNGRTEKTFRKHIESTCENRMRAIVQIVDLNEKQAAKVRFALKGDVERFFRELAVLREKTEGLNLQNQRDMQEAWQIVAPMYQRVQSGVIFDENSLMERVLRESLDQEQRQRLEEFEFEQRRARFEAVVRATIVEIQRGVPLVSRQRTELLQAALELGPPTSNPGLGTEAYLGYVALARIPDDKLENILDKNQLEALNKTVTRYEGIGGIEWE